MREARPIPAAVHPHACGDNCFAGSSRAPPTRFTPTRVGTTFPAITGHTVPSVHPHACGDNGVIPVHVVEIRRFTPTRVGTTK